MTVPKTADIALRCLSGAGAGYVFAVSVAILAGKTLGGSQTNGLAIGVLLTAPLYVSAILAAFSVELRYVLPAGIAALVLSAITHAVG